MFVHSKGPSDTRYKADSCEIIQPHENKKHTGSLILIPVATSITASTLLSLQNSLSCPKAICNTLILLPTGRDKMTGGELGACLLKDLGAPWSGSHF